MARERLYLGVAREPDTPVGDSSPDAPESKCAERWSGATGRQAG